MTIVQKLTDQWQLFQLAVMFFTRIPICESVPYSAQRLNQSSRYFSLVGILVAVIALLAFETSRQLWSVEVSILLAMSVSFLITGGFHEDGIADTADGIAGGVTIEQRLFIMKDSRIGTYGVLALFSVVLLKFHLLSALTTTHWFWLSVILGHSLSRAIAGSLIFDSPYISAVDTSKSKPVAERQTVKELTLLLLLGVTPLIAFVTESFVLMLVISLVATLALVRMFARRWFIKHLGGITGDCLGAVQQVAELVIYFVILAVVAQK